MGGRQAMEGAARPSPLGAARPSSVRRAVLCRARDGAGSRPDRALLNDANPHLISFKVALLANAGSIILAHNHPSGDPTPSRDDVQLTRRIAHTGKIIGIDVLDHVIVGDGQWASLHGLGVRQSGTNAALLQVPMPSVANGRSARRMLGCWNCWRLVATIIAAGPSAERQEQ